jgi:CubicO group peptidase (beta-lactamase class C family)
MRWNAMMALVTAALALPVLETPTPAAAAPPGCAPATPAAVAELFDARVPPLIGNATIPGAVVSVVAGGQTVFAKGYGLADVHSGAPMDATATPVRIASITKLFTFTAVMQQVQAGRLDLGADVNTYLDFRIPATYPRPITVLDLLDHTAARGLPEGEHPGPDPAAGRGLRLLELRRGPRRLPRRAGHRRAVRAVHPAAPPRPARHGPQQRRRAAAVRARAQLQHR